MDLDTWIKICGNTTVEDARVAMAAGADALGFIFASSRRQVRPEQVRPIADQLSQMERIGVFLNESPERIAEIFAGASLTGVQIHGDESPEQVREIRDRLEGLVSFKEASAYRYQEYSSRAPFRILKTLRFTPRLEEELERFSERGVVDAILIDTFSPDMRGGTGVPFDWKQAGEILESATEMPIVIAGGLKTENVQQVIAMLKPWGVDVASGVEREPGRKHPQKLMNFCRAVREYRPTSLAKESV